MWVLYLFLGCWCYSFMNYLVYIAIIFMLIYLNYELFGCFWRYLLRRLGESRFHKMLSFLCIEEISSIQLRSFSCSSLRNASNLDKWESVNSLWLCYFTLIFNKSSFNMFFNVNVMIKMKSELKKVIYVHIFSLFRDVWFWKRTIA